MLEGWGAGEALRAARAALSSFSPASWFLLRPNAAEAAANMVPGLVFLLAVLKFLGERVRQESCARPRRLAVFWLSKLTVAAVAVRPTGHTDNTVPWYGLEGV